MDKNTLDQLNDDSKKCLQQIETQVIPTLIALRRTLNDQLTQEDQTVLADIATRYEEINEMIEQIVSRNSFHEFHRTNLSILKLKNEYLIEQQNRVEGVIQQDRAIFQKARALGIKLDSQIDAIMYELQQMENIAPVIKLEEQATQRTEQVELARNIAFLLTPTEYEAPSAIEMAQEVHQMAAAPMPVATTQTLSFQLQQSGWLHIELMDVNGKVIQTLLKENLPAGKHQYQFDVSEVSSGIFFYRMSSEEGISTLKSVKVE